MNFAFFLNFQVVRILARGCLSGFVAKGLRPLQPVCSGALASLTPALRSLRKAFCRLLAPKLRLHVVSLRLAFPPASPPCHRYIALAHIAYGGLGGHPCESCPEAVGKRALPPYTRAFPPRAPPCMSRCLSSCVAVSAKQSTIITHTSVRAEDCSRSSAGAYRSRDNLPHAITVCVRQSRSERPERMKRARKRAIQKVLRSMKRARKRALQKGGVATAFSANICC